MSGRPLCDAEAFVGGRTECAALGGARFTFDSFVEQVGITVAWTKRVGAVRLDPSEATYHSAEIAAASLRAALMNPAIVEVSVRFDKTAHPLSK